MFIPVEERRNEGADLPEIPDQIFAVWHFIKSFTFIACFVFEVFPLLFAHILSRIFQRMTCSEYYYGTTTMCFHILITDDKNENAIEIFLFSISLQKIYSRREFHRVTQLKLVLINALEMHFVNLLILPLDLYCVIYHDQLVAESYVK